MNHETIRVSEGESADEEKYALYLKHFLALKKSCRELLELYFSRVSESVICQTLGLKNVMEVKNKKRHCKEKLNLMVQSDPLFKEINERKN